MYFSNNIIIFRLYLVIAIAFLMPICLIITNELIEFISCFIIIRQYVKNINFLELHSDKILILFQYYLKKQKWLTCILMLESFKQISINESSNLLGICYQKINCNIIAEYYYLEASHYYPNNIKILQNLVNIYNMLDKTNELNSLCNIILQLDSNNKIAKKYIKS